MSDGEIRFRFKATDKRFDDIDKRLDRMDEATDERFKRNEDRGQNAWARVLGVLGIAATLIAAVWAAYLSSRGAH